MNGESVMPNDSYKKDLEESNKKENNNLREFNQRLFEVIKSEIHLGRMIFYIINEVIAKKIQEGKIELEKLLALEREKQVIFDITYSHNSMPSNHNHFLPETKSILSRINSFSEEISTKLYAAYGERDQYVRYLGELSDKENLIKSDIVADLKNLIESDKNYCKDNYVRISYMIPPNYLNVDNNRGNHLEIHGNFHLDILKDFLSDVKDMKLTAMDDYLRGKASNLLMNKFSEKFNFQQPLSMEQKTFLSKILEQSTVQKKVDDLAAAAYGFILKDNIIVSKIAHAIKIETDKEVVKVKKAIVDNKIAAFEKIKDYASNILDNINNSNSAECISALESLGRIAGTAESSTISAEKQIKNITEMGSNILAKLNQLKHSSSSSIADISQVSTEIDQATISCMLDASKKDNPGHQLSPANTEENKPSIKMGR